MSDWKIGDDRRRRSTDQLRDLNRANNDEVWWDTEAPADFTYLYHPHRIIVRAEDAEEFDRAVGRLDKDTLPEPPRREDVGRRKQLARYVLARREGRMSVPDLLDQLEERGLGRGKASPDHWVHISPGGGGAACPAVEPMETGLEEPWPPVAPQDEGHDVQVVVVDTGWNPASATDGRTPWLAGVAGDDENNGTDLRQYAGHGTFIAGVVRCMAPRTEVFVEGFAVDGVGGGGILESDIVEQLEEALENHDPKVINLSAGCRTRHDLPSIAFQSLYDDHLRDRDCVLVAAAGNDGLAAPFWPAAFDWCVGVGSLDRDGRVSAFSNYGVSSDVYALGRNLVNAFPDGTYVCHESPDKGDLRRFANGMARWSGTSFAAPIVAGLIAREISESHSSAAQARDVVLGRAVRDSDPVIGPHQELRWPFV
jgi:hypothetical protein